MAETQHINPKKEASISYDKKADILYITFKDAEAVAEHIKENIIVRKDPETGEIVGITIENFEQSGPLTIPWHISA